MDHAVKPGDGEKKEPRQKIVHDCVVYVLCDMEGAWGVTSMDDCVPGTERWRVAGRELSLEAAAAGRGALRGGAGRVVVHDTHAYGVNMCRSLLPSGVEFRQGHSLAPLPILGDVPWDSLVVLLACHVGAGKGGHLPHTFRTRFTTVALNGRPVGEAELYAYLLASRRAAVGVVTGDVSAVDEARSVMPWAHFVSVGRGEGGPGDPGAEGAPEVHERIESTVADAVAEALSDRGSIRILEPPGQVELAVTFSGEDEARGHRCGAWRREGPTLKLRGSFGSVFQAFLDMAYLGRLAPLAPVALPMVRRWALWRYGRP